MISGGRNQSLKPPTCDCVEKDEFLNTHIDQVTVWGNKASKGGKEEGVREEGVQEEGGGSES